MPVARYQNPTVSFDGDEWTVEFPGGEVIDIPDDDLQPLEDERLFYAAVLAIYQHKGENK